MPGELRRQHLTGGQRDRLLHRVRCGDHVGRRPPRDARRALHEFAHVAASVPRRDPVSVTDATVAVRDHRDRLDHDRFRARRIRPAVASAPSTSASSDPRSPPSASAAADTFASASPSSVRASARFVIRPFWRGPPTFKLQIKADNPPCGQLLCSTRSSPLWRSRTGPPTWAGCARFVSLVPRSLNARGARRRARPGGQAHNPGPAPLRHARGRGRGVAQDAGAGSDGPRMLTAVTVYSPDSSWRSPRSRQVVARVSQTTSPDASRTM